MKWFISSLGDLIAIQAPIDNTKCYPVQAFQSSVITSNPQVGRSSRPGRTREYRIRVISSMVEQRTLNPEVDGSSPS